jgi:hypothetical protein
MINYLRFLDIPVDAVELWFLVSVSLLLAIILTQCETLELAQSKIRVQEELLAIAACLPGSELGAILDELLFDAGEP